MSDQFSSELRELIFSTLKEDTFSDIVQLTSLSCGSPLVILHLDGCRQVWVKNATGSDFAAPQGSSFASILKFSQSAGINIASSKLQRDFYDNPIIANDRSICFHASVSIKNSSGETIGLLHVLSKDEVSLNSSQINTLKLLAGFAAKRIDREFEIHQEKILADEEYVKQKEFLNTVLENLGDGVIACNDQGQLSVFNRAIREFHGLDPGTEIPPEKWIEHYKFFQADGKTPLPLNEIPLRRAFKGEVVKDAVIVVESISNGKKTLRCSGRAIYDNKGKKLGAVITMHDTTAVNSAHAKVDRSTKLLQTLIDSCPVGICVFDLEGKMTMFNRGGEQIFGWTENEMMGRQAQLNAQDRNGYFRKILDKVSATRQKVEEEVRRVRKDGKEIDVHFTMIPLINDESELYGFMSVVIDVSEIKLREQSLLDANRALKAASAAKSEFLANMSHEIRTPLNGIMGMTYLVLQSDLGPVEREHLELVQSSADSLHTIVSDILDFSKIEAGKIEIENAKFDLLKIADDVHETLSLAAEHKNLKLKKSISGDTTPTFTGDANRIKQILSNLVSNAIKFSDSGEIHTSISFSKIDENRANIRFEVKDQGVGISEAVVSKLFQAFSQADSSTTRRFGGTGLGLSICKRLVDLMNGEIGVESEIGKGSKFWFSIKLDYIKSKVVISDSHSELTPAKPIILLAEDNYVNQVVAKNLLTNFGFDTHTVPNGKEAIEALKTKEYDLVLMDCQMPEMDGYEATRIIRTDKSLPNNIGIIAVTAHALNGDREKCLDAGMNDYITKPLRAEELEKVIKNYLRIPIPRSAA